MEKPDAAFEALILEHLPKAINRLAWIRTTFETHLPRQINGPVALLAVGDGDDAPFIRDLAPDAQIFMVDIAYSPIANVLARHSNATYALGDIREVDATILLMDRNFPDTIIIRHPRILESSDADAITINDWWLDCLAEWVRKAQEHSSQVLITTYTEVEAQHLVARIQERTGLDLTYTINDVAPSELSTEHPSPEGIIVARPDYCVIAIG